MRKIILAFLALIVVCCGEMENSNKTLVIGHRGAMGHETENTLASVEKALEMGVDMIEIDVFKIESGEIVVFHDERVDKLTNGVGNIEEYNIVDLRQLTLDGNHKIPMLQDVLKLIDNRIPLNIELKGSNTTDRINFIIEYYINERGWQLDNFIISSFKWEELRAMRQRNPDIAIAVLTEDDPVEAIPIAEELKAVAINPNFRSLTPQKVQEIKEAGFKIYTWTVNEPKNILEMKTMGVDGIFTNFPERLH